MDKGGRGTSPSFMGQRAADAQATIAEKTRRAVTRTPFWVIAVSVHLVLAAVLGMMTFAKQESRSMPASVEVAIAQPANDDARLEDAAPIPEPIERSAIPVVDDTDVRDLMDDLFTTATDDVVNPWATSAARFGVSEGTEDGPDDLLSMSMGGKGLAGAIGLGSGSAPGGGARRGSPLGGSRIARRNSQAGKLRQTEAAVMAGLDWLARHQSEDGSWDCDGFSLQCDPARGDP